MTDSGPRSGRPRSALPALGLLFAFALAACGEAPGPDPVTAPAAPTVEEPAVDSGPGWPALADLPWDPEASLPSLDEYFPEPGSGDRRLEGVVVDADGKPVAGADVIAEALPLGAAPGILPRVHAETVSGADGSFRLGPLPEPWEGAGIVAASREGFARTALRSRSITLGDGPTADPDTPVTLTLLRGVEVRGQVVDQDGRAPLAPVRIWALGEPSFSHHFTTNETGGFTFRAPPGEVSLTTIAGEHAPVRASVSLSPDAPAEVEIRVQRVDDLRGRVLDNLTGRPVPGARIRAFYDRTRIIAADEQGEFVLPHYWFQAFQVRAPGWAERIFPVRPTATGGHDESVVVGLARGLVVTGTVRDVRGRPLEGVRLRVLRHAPSGVRADLVGPRTEADGSFTFVGVPLPLAQREVRLFAGGADWGWGFSEAFTPDSVAGRERIDGVAISVPRLVTLAGRVVDEYGEPQEALVRADWMYEDGMRGYGSALGSRRSAVADLDGEFEIEVPEGAPCRLTVVGRNFQKTIRELTAPTAPPAGEPGSGSATPDAAGPDVVVEVFVGLAIRGVVRDASGEPVRRGSVRVEPSPPADGRRAADTEVLEDGTFVVPGLQPGRYDLSVVVHPEFLQEVHRDLEAGDEPLTVVLRRPGALTGRIVRPAGVPMQATTRLHVRALGETAPLPARFTRLVSRQDGAFVIERMAPGAYRVRAMAAGWLHPGTVVEVGEGDPTPAGALELRRGGSIGGTLVDDGGAPAPGVTVEVFGVDDDGRPDLRGRAVTDADGAWSVTGLLPGPHRVSVLAVGRPLLEHAFEAVLDTEITADLALAKGGAIDVRVEDATGQPVPAARVQFQGPDGSLVYWQRDSEAPPPFVTGSDGTLACVGLAPGTLRVFVQGPGGRNGEVQVEVVEGGETVTVTVVLGER